MKIPEGCAIVIGRLIRGFYWTLFPKKERGFLDRVYEAIDNGISAFDATDYVYDQILREIKAEAEAEPRHWTFEPPAKLTSATPSAPRLPEAE